MISYCYLSNMKDNLFYTLIMHGMIFSAYDQDVISVLFFTDKKNQPDITEWQLWIS